MQRFGEKLHTLRVRHGLTIRELAEALGYSAHAHISLVETGRRKPSRDLIVRAAQFFNVSTDELLRDDLDLDSDDLIA